MALGESRASVLRRVLIGAGRLAAAGGVVGAGVVLTAAPSLSPFLYQVDSRDPVILVGIPLLLIGFALASALPAAIRASRTDPSDALRSE